MARLKVYGPSLRAADVRTVKPPPFVRPPKIADPFYSSAAWIELRNRVRREAGGKCQWPGCKSHGRWVDHRIEIKDGGPRLDRANTWLLCPSHHTEKTAIEKRRREQGKTTQ